MTQTTMAKELIIEYIVIGILVTRLSTIMLVALFDTQDYTKDQVLYISRINDCQVIFDHDNIIIVINIKS